jgi:ATP-dependent DNA helicase RecG
MQAAQEFWKTPIAYLKRVGAGRALVLNHECDIYTYEDLLHYYPRKYVDRRLITPIHQLNQEGEYVSVVGTLGPMQMPPSLKTKRLATTLYDGTGYISLVWFGNVHWLASKYKAGDEVVAFGKVTIFNGQKQISHPEIELIQDPNQPQVQSLRILPFYASTDKLKQNGVDARLFRQWIEFVLAEGKAQLSETLPAQLLAQYGLMPRAWSLQQIHFPDTPEDLNQARRRLKFEELFLFELIMGRRKHLLRHQRPAYPFTSIGTYFNRFYAEYLPFQLTDAQKRVVKEIRFDVGQPEQMNRLVQGDVGSGKTMVAIMSMLIAIDNQFQVAMMAPTEILAEQHYHTIYRLLSPMNINVDLLVGSQKAAVRKRVLRDIASGITHVTIGTHAVLEDPVVFNRLGLTIIDEQHKFGVKQRARLWAKAPKGFTPHNIAMTATPIPRTLMMTAYGDIDVSIIDELPPGRKPVQTYVIPHAQRLKVYGFMRSQLEAGRQVYVVFPLIEESEKLDLAAATAGWQILHNEFPKYQIGLVHGKLPSEEKDATMQAFKAGNTHILVATSVIEVGVDVPNASVMVIENAERFGLSQLHQLRGRVGRGAEQSFTLLLTGDKLGDIAKRRLKALADTNDGFKIAEMDLQLRGPGDLLGTRQSGLPEFKLADLTQDEIVLKEARDAAIAFLTIDLDFTLPEHALLKQQFDAFVAKHRLEEWVA